MENFGPFPGKAVVDFRLLEDIFLITGKTGAGKTSVFDAVCYALYGKVPGSRSASIERLISDFAGRGAEASVVLEFSAGAGVWKVERVLRAETGKDGAVTVDSSALLFRRTAEETWEAAASRKSETNAKLLSILGLNAEEFFKIVLLPQGEFAEFLQLKTQDRRQILAKLFPIDKAARVMEAAREKARQLKSDALAARKNLEEALSRVRFETYDEEHLRAVTEAEAAGEAARGAEARYRDFRDRWNLVEERRREREKAARDAEEKSARRRECAARMEALEQRREKVLEAGEERRRLALRLPWLEELAAKKTKLLAAGQEAAALEQELAAAVLECSGHRRKLAVLDEEKKQLEEQAGEADDLENRREAEHQKIEALKELKKELAAAEETETERAASEQMVLETGEALAALERRIPVLEAECAALQEEHKKARQGEAAALLAASLREGEPCPVCGAVDHPFPAAAIKRAFGLEERIASLEGSIRDAAEKRSKLRADWEHERGRLALCDKRLGEQRGRLVTLAAAAAPEKTEAAAETPPRLPRLSEVGARLAARSKAFEELANRRDAARRARTRLLGFFEERGRLLDQYNRLETRRAALAEKTSHRKETIALLKKEEQELFARLDMGPLEAGALDPAAVRQRIKDCERYAADYAREREELVAACSAAAEAEQSALKRGEETMALLEAALERGPVSGEELAALEREKSKRAELLQKAASALAALEENRRRLDEAASRAETLSREAARFEALDRDLSGRNPKKKPFDSWLLSLYLAEVAAFATRRLERMSEGRYSLQLDTAGNKRGLSGLDLSVFDGDTGRRRPCGTLSGGESFMASISLALGLADSIQARHGELLIEAVFIDEGFGSLDDEALQKALTILDELRETRMVALISHVAEMRGQIPSTVEILKTQAGSRIIQ
jgi:exonuclease SbcC